MLDYLATETTTDYGEYSDKMSLIVYCSVSQY